MILTLQRFSNFCSLAVGNHKRFNCKVSGYRQKISMSIITVYLSFFAIGLMLGDLSVSAGIKLESIIGLFSTIVVAVIGTNILIKNWRQHNNSPGVHIATLAVMGAQAAYVFNLYPIPIVNSLFEVVAIISMIILYRVSSNRS